MSVTCYPQPGKAKSRLVLEAFAAGCVGAIHGGPVARELSPGAAAFYGVVGIEHLLRQARAERRDYYYADNAYFDRARQKLFRVEKNGLQASGKVEPAYERLNALGITVKPWTRTGRHVLVVMQSPHFMREVAAYPGGAEGWQNDTLWALKKHTDRLIVVRHWSRDKAERARTLQDDLKNAWALVTHASAAANEAVLAGVPVFITGPCAALPMGLSQLEQIESPRRPDGREEWAAGLAARQWTLDEFRSGMAWRALSS